MIIISHLCSGSGCVSRNTLLWIWLDRVKKVTNSQLGAVKWRVKFDGVL